MIRPALTPIAARLPETVPFVGPEALERASGRAFRARLGANESRFGPAPAVLNAMIQATNDSWKYCDPEVFLLRQTLADHHGIKADEVTVGEGVDGVLGLCVRLFAGPGDSVVTSLGGYPTFNYHVTGFGAQLHTVPYIDDREDLEGLLAATRRQQAKIVYLANPDNPMGSWWPAEAVQRFIEAVPPTTLLLLDEAYGELAPAGTLPAIDTSRPNVLRLRTFSKAYGMAGLRCGYAIGEATTIRAFERVRNHFGVNNIAQAAAIAAIGEHAYLAEVVERTAAARRRIARIAEANGLVPLPSATNFVAIDCGRDGAFAGAVLKGLAERGVFIRKPMTPGLDRCIRVSVGLDADLDLFEAMLPEAVQHAGR
ncbi:histidinol-phosphate aminotransferase [Devosia limi DSM 17137]|uniref:Histidinol-phosphate aminotransferase n=1 Tax=Devosia limi DSM 17137 TaxID=1121477 RepID=A0A0F5LR77_9HYPH|nr:pyridoxal phosphate-dependent aminotransferase [Devosia limi]KKB84875.1 histidinol-phosphate aminotransferase [Devosia limi DSM 17137]SHF07433.1 histidinol-phosphate aminotransferase [Devosia limi DSM 17137]